MRRVGYIIFLGNVVKWSNWCVYFRPRAVKIILEVFRWISKKFSETRVDFRRNICPMKMGPSLRHAPLYPLHADIYYTTWKYHNFSSTHPPIWYSEKKTVFQKCSKFPHFQFLFEFFFSGEMYFGDCFITPYNNINKQNAVNGRNFENAGRPPKGALAP